MSNPSNGAAPTHPLAPYDALLLVSFGGPEGPDEVIDFLEIVTKGSGVPRERLEHVGEHYFRFGGRSPINDQNRALIAALHSELADRGADMPIYWGNRNWHPFITQALEEIVTAGHHRVLMLTTSAYPSYSGCRSYREDVQEALDELDAPLVIDRIGNYGLDDGFVTANAQALQAALGELPGAHVLFVTHSIPTAMDEASGPVGESGAYVGRHLDVAGRVATVAGGASGHELVFCSRSGRPETPWLEPDVNDRLAELHEKGIDRVVIAPIGFVSDHMEVIYDLDTEARQTCDELGMTMVRAATVGTMQPFVAALIDRAMSRADQARVQPGCPLQTPEGCGGHGCCANSRAPLTPALD